MKTPTFVATLAVSLLAGLPAGAAVITLQEGLNSYAGTDDTTLIQNNSDGDYGGRNEILLGATGANQQRAGVIRFDVSALDGLYSQINTITLEFTVFRADADNSYDVRLMNAGNADWVEGTANSATTTGVATWSHAIYDTEEWAGGQSGGRFIPADNYGNVASFAILSTTALDTRIQINIDPSGLPANVDTATEIVDLWQTQNAGFQIYGGNGQNGVDSSEGSTANHRPALLIDYTPIPEPSTFALLGLGVAALFKRRSR